MFVSEYLKKCLCGGTILLKQEHMHLSLYIDADMVLGDLHWHDLETEFL
jgi:hypothetical protein